MSYSDDPTHAFADIIGRVLNGNTNGIPLAEYDIASLFRVSVLKLFL